MQRPVITGNPVPSRVLLIGQAPGIHEAEVRQPFGWTAGKTLFQWFAGIGLTEAPFRQQVYISAVCRCFPGKNPGSNGRNGGDRVPTTEEIMNCAHWLRHELALLQPDLILPVGKLAISRFLTLKRLQDVIGQCFRHSVPGHEADIIPLPHPSGASTWHRMEPGRTLLAQALATIARHPAWQALLEKQQTPST
ncbi:MAG: uracil-DNA glycosylase family protein [Thiothrix sp.]|nr:uracil-DNA glycosylase family protein [Thiothrix sp.]